ncbi:MAG TPA: hypothetical protein VN635_06735 [Conexibacter sp.]|nr:hypothetical protein [Conexibacter sp.]
MGRTGVACVLALLAVAGCGGSASAPQACIQAQSSEVLHALAHAPGRVALADGTLLSQCVRRTVDDVRLQALGATFTLAADTLAQRMRTSDAAAYQLGFLIGATARGAAQAAGLQDDLARRVAGSAGPDGGPRRAALLRGRAAGLRIG